MEMKHLLNIILYPFELLILIILSIYLSLRFWTMTPILIVWDGIRGVE